MNQQSNACTVGAKVGGRTIFAAAIIWACTSTGAWAQTQAQDAAGQNQNGVSQQLQEITVTASKFGSPLSRAPVSASVLSLRSLQADHIDNLTDIGLRVPGITIDNPVDFAEVYIRGIGSIFTLAGLESPNALFIDGVYIQQQWGPLFDLVDMDNVQVLKGPQSTLYGRNATGGALLLNTANPGPDFGGYLTAEYGSYDHSKFTGAVNIPLSNTLSMRLAGQATSNGGYISAPSLPAVNGEAGGNLGADSSYDMRAKIRWAPSDDFSAMLSLEGSYLKNTHNAQRTLNPQLLCAACAIYGIQPTGGFYDASAYAPPNYDKSLMSTLTLNGKVGDIDFTSITALRGLSILSQNDQEATTAYLEFSRLINTATTITDDSYARSNFDFPVNFLAGFSYEYDHEFENENLSGDVFGPLSPAVYDNYTSLKSYAGYGELYWNITPALKITAGARYSSDTKTLYINNLPPNGLALAGGQEFYNFTPHAFDSVTPRGVISYDAGRMGLYYISYSVGTRSGGFATPALAPPPSAVDSEKLASWEIGVKNVALGNQLHVTIDGFRGRYTDIQVSQEQDTSILTENAGAAMVQGIEFDLNAKVTDSLSAQFGGTYLHNFYTLYQNASVYCPPALGGDGPVSCPENLTDTPLPRSPRFSGYLALDYRQPLANGWSVAPAAIAHYTTGYYFDSGAGGLLVDTDRQRAYTMVNATLTLYPPTAPITIGLYVTNLLGSKYYSLANTDQLVSYYVPGDPRMYGVNLNYHF
jgi:iron complex outermembrane receptor protein